MKHFVFGNWKSNGSRKVQREFARAFGDTKWPERVVCGLSLPYHLIPSVEGLERFRVGAQNVSAHGPGAYTGEIHAGMLKELGCNFSLVGHSERRRLFGESPADTTLKMSRLLEAGLCSVLCVGETLDERREGKLREVLTEQLEALRKLPRAMDLIVAYEPVWAIGTGVSAEPEDAEEAHGIIRELLNGIGFSQTPILYGGSVKPKSAEELGAVENINGFLVGGASLEGEDFRAIVDGYARAKKLS